MRNLLFLTVIAALLGSCASQSAIFPLEMKAPSANNTGDVRISMLKNSGNNMIVHFMFEKGSRNFWHYHPDAEQTLLVLDGEGYYQEEGKAKRLIRKGDVIVTPPNMHHWNGATPGKRIYCMTVTEHSPEKHVIQLREVTEEEYSETIKH
ncbi:cupin domain-containing protein [Bacteroides helcogenes]|uniref:Cupin 2 conserved barrel domain protein n=1 Tax=Bacteroides helcogenes (strain ATCC 35417 / DSM 20613 / JCM 6297 / CCUG 15421 / P 36-108) TaxID=693979 RepID=E6STX5_BACT6|nr:cupin domain-containing protein [Bacteroides helcogenes]ADV43276.1 Cupin 2 conserved barrel domain protein [Bacteroides helcogenes P 36-108]MDY5238615.1 cupin domain-containing protein [Bacteroides helcogenes]